MKDLYTKYVYVVDIEQKRVINTTDNADDMKKRLKKNPKYYGEDTSNFIYVQANVTSPLVQLSTNELLGYHMIQNAIVAGIVSGVSVEDVITKLEESNFIRRVSFENESASEK